MKSFRERARQVRRAARLRSWFKALARLYREAPSFSRTEALALALTARAPLREVNRILRELEEDGCIEGRGSDIFAFAPPPHAPG